MTEISERTAKLAILTLTSSAIEDLIGGLKLVWPEHKAIPFLQRALDEIQYEDLHL